MNDDEQPRYVVKSYRNDVEGVDGLAIVDTFGGYDGMAAYTVHHYQGRPDVRFDVGDLFTLDDARGFALALQELADRWVSDSRCKQCGHEMSPVEAMLSSTHGVCGKCTRINHRRATGK